jgi:DNA-binding NarL/FixJ family response regulator
VVVADDQAAVRAGLVLILGAAPDIEVVGEAADGDEAVRACRRLRPDVAVLDVRMPRRDGISATREIVDDGLAEVLVLTTFDLDEYAFAALRAGAAGFVLKDTDAAGLVDAVRTVARGDGVIAPAVTRRLIRAFAASESVKRAKRASDAAGNTASESVKRAKRASDAAGNTASESVNEPALTAVETLTPREREVLACLGAGMSNLEIARRLGMAESTAKTHVSRILTKLGLHGRVQAAILAQDLARRHAG